MALITLVFLYLLSSNVSRSSSSRAFSYVVYDPFSMVLNAFFWTLSILSWSSWVKLECHTTHVFATQYLHHDLFSLSCRIGVMNFKREILKAALTKQLNFVREFMKQKVSFPKHVMVLGMLCMSINRALYMFNRPGVAGAVL